MASPFNDSNLIVVEQDSPGASYNIRERQTDGTLVQTIVTQVPFPTIALDKDGNLYIAHRTVIPAVNQVRKFLSDGTDQGVVIDIETEVGNFPPELVGVDNDGYIYVADRNSNDVHKFTSVGAFDQTYDIVNGESSPENSSVNSDGTLYYYKAHDMSGNIEARAYDLVVNADIGAFYTQLLGTDSFVGILSIRVHNSGDLLINWNRVNGSSEEAIHCARVTAAGVVVWDEEVVTSIGSPNDYAGVTLAILKNTRDVAEVGVIWSPGGPLNNGIYHVDIDDGTVTLAYDVIGSNLFGIGHVFGSVIFQGLTRLNPDASVQWQKLSGF